MGLVCDLPQFVVGRRLPPFARFFCVYRIFNLSLIISYNDHVDMMRVAVGEKEFQVRSARVARMIAALIERERRIGEALKGSVVFNFSGREGLSIDVNEKEDLSQAPRR